MSYTHFGKYADVFKHLVLCDLIDRERPEVYIETNSASAEYTIEMTPEQKYGIYTFLEKAVGYPALCGSDYYQLENTSAKESKYLGSPGLAMLVLKDSAKQFHFFDIEAAPLENIENFATLNGLTPKVGVYNQDSVTGVMELLPELPASSFIHIDPYYIDKPAANGFSYLDLFIKASEQGISCLLWYGYNTLAEKESLNYLIKKTLRDSSAGPVLGIELISGNIQKDKIVCNPGVLGNGLLVSNSSEESRNRVLDYSKLLVDLYKGTRYQDYPGDLYREIIVK